MRARSRPGVLLAALIALALAAGSAPTASANAARPAAVAEAPHTVVLVGAAPGGGAAGLHRGLNRGSARPRRPAR